MDVVSTFTYFSDFVNSIIQLIINLPSLEVPINSSNIALICSWADIVGFKCILTNYSGKSQQ